MHHLYPPFRVALCLAFLFCNQFAYTQAPSNDSCVNALPVVLDIVYTGNTDNATDVESLTPCQGPPEAGVLTWGPGVWFLYESNSNLAVFVDTGISDFDSNLQVFSGACGSLTCITGADLDYLNRDIPLDEAALFFEAQTNVDYYIYLDGHNNQTGNYWLRLTEYVPLPVTLTDFTGTKITNGHQLNWTTATEVNTNYFNIERSGNNGATWQTIGQVAAQGNSTEKQTYNFLDRQPLTKNLYRLQMVDFDGSSQYSSVVALEQSITGFQLKAAYPNPMGEQLTLELSNDNGETVDLSVVDIYGKTVYQQNLAASRETQTLAIQLPNLAPGLYYLQLNNGLEQITQRVVKQ